MVFVRKTKSLHCSSPVLGLPYRTLFIYNRKYNGDYRENQESRGFCY